jgi:hypothetical protein
VDPSGQVAQLGQCLLGLRGGLIERGGQLRGV